MKKFLLIFVLLLPFITVAEQLQTPIPKRILVTGGAGFLGSHLCEKLIAEGNIVICADNLYTGSLENINHLIDHPKFTFLNHDVCDPFDMNFYVDEIYNLACPASPIHYQRSPVKTIKTSILGAINVLELAKKCNAKVFQASTSEIYGDPLEHPQKESYWGNVNPIGIRACYDEGKRCSETLFFDYNREYGVRIKVARIFNTYGPKMSIDDGRVVSNFIVQALNDDPITMYGNGEQTRSFCYVSDLIEGIVKLMNSPEEIIGPINLGNPREFTMLELALKVKSYTGSNSQIIFLPLPSDDPKKRKPDITIAKKILNWEPEICLDTGLIKTIEYFEKKIQKNAISSIYL